MPDSKQNRALRMADIFAESLVERFRFPLPDKVLVVTFRPEDPPERATMFSSAGASDLIPVLRSLVVRLEAGTLRMPVMPSAVRWVDEEGRRVDTDL